MSNSWYAGLGFVVLCLFLFTLSSLPADHGKWVKNFESFPQLEREFGAIDPNGSTDQFTAFLYEGCLNDRVCGNNE